MSVDSLSRLHKHVRLRAIELGNDNSRDGFARLADAGSLGALVILTKALEDTVKELRAAVAKPDAQTPSGSSHE